MPSPGTTDYLRVPSGPGIRDDSSMYNGCEITPNYDPMLSKLVVWAETREAAIDRMASALKEYIVLGVKTNIGFLIRVMAEQEFREGKIDTGYIDRHQDLLMPGTDDLEPALIAAALSMNEATGPQAAGDQRPVSNWKLYGRKIAVSGGGSV